MACLIALVTRVTCLTALSTARRGGYTALTFASLTWLLVAPLKEPATWLWLRATKERPALVRTILLHQKGLAGHPARARWAWSFRSLVRPLKVVAASRILPLLSANVEHAACVRALFFNGQSERRRAAVTWRALWQRGWVRSCSRRFVGPLEVVAGLSARLRTFVKESTLVRPLLLDSQAYAWLTTSAWWHGAEIRTAWRKSTRPRQRTAESRRKSTRCRWRTAESLLRLPLRLLPSWRSAELLLLRRTAELLLRRTAELLLQRTAEWLLRLALRLLPLLRRRRTAELLLRLHLRLRLLLRRHQERHLLIKDGLLWCWLVWSHCLDTVSVERQAANLACCCSDLIWIIRTVRCCAFHCSRRML